MEAIPVAIKILSTLPALIQAGANVYNLIVKTKDLLQHAHDGTVSTQEIEDIEAMHDSELARFNLR